MIPDGPGVYVLGRQFGALAIPLYIGRSENMRVRLGQHLKSVPLMTALKNAEIGKRFFLACSVQLKRGQRLQRVLRVLEDGLIAHALTEGHELFQTQGTRRPAHLVHFSGNRASECIAPRSMYIRSS